MSLIFIFVSSLCTSLGAMIVLLIRNLSHRGKDVVLAYTAGIMVATSAYGLIPSALKLSNMHTLIIGILFGTFLLTLIEVVVPHTDLDHSNQSLRGGNVVLFMIAMSIHNFPEGLSVGISSASSNEDLGYLVAFAIGLQNVPEGFLIALFLVTQGVSRFKAIFFSVMTGVVELSAGLFGYVFGDFFAFVVPYGLAFAAGSMLFVVYKELIPESHGDGNERVSTIAFIIGFITMIYLTEVFR
ncbi:ZIP family metal transporter [Mangrovibacillus cuniculi]|uniref:ZIP family metal transporter n=1 Tax=Mangrovibacillus cuniculi TaxID=2593652 RepID=A0A7S8HGU1_9BACI|nr:ZIP family metal transporter [Mangrovibacillus cuniculi]QPC48263.1 ZIP family metal transporter [Mangrovibacillus cuniculi]